LENAFSNTLLAWALGLWGLTVTGGLGVFAVALIEAARLRKKQ
jgi:hypothetical protein